ncbi:c-type heme family protein [Lyngbya aestuarii]|uniref:c-type heme family protein n=1 Tax=Lyngbya aestuarii TaxID=118322 RepID=UPI00403DE4E8
MNKVFKNLNLGAKLNLILLAIFLVVVLVSGLLLSIILGNYAKKVVADEAIVLIETMGAVREYTSNQVNPELAPRLETEEQFLPQTVPGYSAREVFENLRKTPQYSNFFYKEATLNPTNLRDKADAFETTIVENFRNQSNLKELTGFRYLPSGRIFYVARPLAVSEESCLRCHSTPEAAPKSQILTYGSDNGFGWQLNEVVGARIISTPASEVINAARRLQLLVIGILIGFFLIAVLIINLFLKFSVVRHLKEMAQLSRQVSTGNMEGEFKHDSNDEIGVLAASLNRMKVSLQMAMDMLNSESK